MYAYDKSKLVRKIYKDCEIIEYDGKPIMKLRRDQSL